jgi:tetratricopeptide (TPR) repeat protein
MTTTPAPAPRKSFSLRAVLLAGLALAVLGAGGYFIFRWLQPKPPAADMTAALEANLRGVGLMERYAYDKAVEAFEEVTKTSPDWMPGRINLGIALLNQGGTITPNTPEQQKERSRVFGRSVAQFKGVLSNADATDKDKTYAHYCLGVIYMHLGKEKEAVPHIEVVTRLDPSDPGGWFRLARLVENEDPKRAASYLERALEIAPSHGGALNAYQLNPYIREHFPEKGQRAMERFKALTQAKLFEDKERYGELGFYAECIGRIPSKDPPRNGPLPPFVPREFEVKLAPGTRWAKAADFGEGPVAELRALLRRRFGAVIVVLDFNRDGLPDLFLLGAVVQDGKLRNLLLRNDDKGHFTDVTAQAGLAGPHASLACTVADFDNDGYSDLFISGAGEQRLFRNRRDGTFQDVTIKAGLGELHTVCLGSTFVDIDEDGDLDLLVAECARTPEEALVAVRGEKIVAGGQRLFVNKGEATPASRGQDPPPLTAAFREERFAWWWGGQPPAWLGPRVGAVGSAASDLDNDLDPDLVTLPLRGRVSLVLNDRLLSLHRVVLPESVAPPNAWNGVLTLDVNRDERPDLFLVPVIGKPLLLLRQEGRGVKDPASWYKPGTIQSPSLRQAQAIDVDLDGFVDVVGLSSDGKPVLLHNKEGRLVHVADALGAGWPKDLIAVHAVDLNGDCRPDILGWSESKGLVLRVAGDNGNQGLKVLLRGHRRVDTEHGGCEVRCNADGFGTRVAAQAVDFWTGVENVTHSAGLGQSDQPLILGLGRHTQAEVLRLRWPDNCWQAELNLDTGRLHEVHETNRKRDSCPLLFTWDGHRFAYVTDFLGAGSVGERLAGGGHRRPRPEESVKIPARLLQPKDGQLVLKLAEPMDELCYLDRVQLLVLDHPAGADVYPDERFATADPPATQDLLSFERRIRPVSAHNHRGADVTAKLRAWDRDTVDDFAWRSWLGLAEEHWVELDFGDRLKQFGPKDRLFLFLAGWTDYAYPDSLWAASQAGVAAQAPLLERKGADGKWHTVGDIGFPAGLPRMMTYELTGKLGGSSVFRIRTNLRVFWDEVFLAPVVDRVTASQLDKGENAFKLFRATLLEVSRASLYARGCTQEFSPDGNLPTVFDYNRLEPMMVSRFQGRMTRFGDVTELLRQRDDRFVIFGAGDEVEVRFDAGSLPPLPKGWQRSYVLRTWGYCKDTGPFTAAGDTVEPLPFRAMSNYPPGPGEKYPDTPLHRDYLKRYNTRQVGHPRR